MADADHERLLHRFRPALLYDSQEAYVADHPAQMVVNPGNVLRRKDGKVARTDDGTLTLATLARTCDVRLSVDVRTADGTVLRSVTVSRSLDPGDHEPERIPTTKLGVVLIPVIERLKKLLRR